MTDNYTYEELSAAPRPETKLGWALSALVGIQVIVAAIYATFLLYQIVMDDITIWIFVICFCAAALAGVSAILISQKIRLGIVLAKINTAFYWFSFCAFIVTIIYLFNRETPEDNTLGNVEDLVVFVFSVIGAIAAFIASASMTTLLALKSSRSIINDCFK